MKTTLKIIGAFIGILFLMFVVTFIIGFAAEGQDFFLYKFFAPKYEAVRRQTFEQTKSYTQGMSQDLDKMQMEYVNASPENKDALASIILHKLSGYDENNLSSSQRLFLDQLKATHMAPPQSTK